MQKRLLTEPDLNIARALELAMSIEAAALETKGFKDPSSIAGASGKVLNVEGAAAASSTVLSGQNLSGTSPSGGSYCHRCGCYDHDGGTCKYRQAKCHLCGKIDHISPVCRRGLTMDKYPLPRPEDIFTTLTGGKRFTTLDLSHAYNQLILDEVSRKYVVVQC